jgi:hypothetical protein
MLRINFYEVGKYGDGRCQSIGEDFAYFTKKVKDRKFG